tara:strand:+ start:613 stop:795 length:183 start_codon:yes stop_codon:yes gene_type:complete
MRITESQLRRLIRRVIKEHITDEHHDHPHEHDEEEEVEEPMGDESIKKVYTIVKQVNDFL